MPSSSKNILAGGPGRLDTSPDVFEAAAPRASGVFQGYQPLGLQVGRQQGHNHEETIRAVNWVKTNDGTSSFVTADGHPSALLLTTQATANTGTQGQIAKDAGVTAWPRFRPTAGMNIYLEALIALSDAVSCGLLVGLAPTDTTLLDAASTIGGCTDFLGFYKAPAAATLVGALRKASASTLRTLASSQGPATNLTNAGFVSLGMRVNGVTSVDFFVGGVMTPEVVMTNLPSVDLALSIALDTAAAAARTATVRRLVCFQEAA